MASYTNAYNNMRETRKERFKRLATYRTSAVLDKLRILANLSNKANYDYSDDEVRKIFAAIDSQLRLIKAKFATNKKGEFKL